MRTAKIPTELERKTSVLTCPTCSVPSAFGLDARPMLVSARSIWYAVLEVRVAESDSQGLSAPFSLKKFMHKIMNGNLEAREKAGN